MSRRVHDAVADSYNSGSGIIAEKNRRVAASLARGLAPRAGKLETLDLGVGDGAMLSMLHDLGLPSRMTGLDVSPAMLRRAAARVPIKTIEAPAQRALEVLAPHSFDLVLAHFIFAYVNRAVLLSQARALLAPHGVLSLVTTTEEGGAPFYAGLERHFRRSRHPLRRVIAWAAERALGQSHVPKSFSDLERDIAAAGLSIQRRETLRVPVTFDGPEDAYRFGIDEGWAANFLDMPVVPVALARLIARWGVHQAGYPFAFTHVIEMLELGKSQPNKNPTGAEETMNQQQALADKAYMQGAQMAEPESGGR